MTSISNNSNNHSDPIMNITTIIFTPTSTTITDAISVPQVPYLKIQIIPTANGKDVSSLKFWYCNNNFVPSRLNEEISEEKFFRSSLVYSLETDGDTLIDRTVSYMKALSPDEICIISNEYTKYIQDGSVLDGFIAGIGAYITFLLLNENGIFMNQMPFQFTFPYTVRSGVIFNRNIFQHLSLPLTSLSKVSHDILFQLVVFIQSFINMWEPLFVCGPSIGISNESRMAMDVISGLSQHVACSLAETRTLNEIMSKQIHSIESRLQSYIDESLINMRREINNLIVESRNSLNDLNKNIKSQLEFIDESVKEKVCKTTEHELDQKIKQLIEMEIESSHERIEELVKWYADNYAKKSVKSSFNNNESELKGILIGLEHRIEVLYNKLESNGLEKLPDIQTHDANRSDEYLTQLSTIGITRPQESYLEEQTFSDTVGSNSRGEHISSTDIIPVDPQLPLTTPTITKNLTHRPQSETRHNIQHDVRRSTTRSKINIHSNGRNTTSGGGNSTTKTINQITTDAPENKNIITIESSNIITTPLVSELPKDTGKGIIPWNRTRWVGTNTINSNKSETLLTSN